MTLDPEDLWQREYEAWRQERDRENARHAERMATDPAYRERMRQHNRAWKAANREHLRAYAREWMRRYRARQKAGA